MILSCYFVFLSLFYIQLSVCAEIYSKSLSKEEVSIPSVGLEEWNSIFPRPRDAKDTLMVSKSLQTIFEHQHPSDCDSKSYLVSVGYSTGFGSEIHVEGMGLAIAMQLGRIYLPKVDRFPEQKYQVPKSLCEGHSNLDCYYEPWTNCSRRLVESLASHQPKVRIFKLSEAHSKIFMETGILPEEAKSLYKEERVLNILLQIFFGNLRTIIPSQLIPLSKALPVEKSKIYYWWRAISASYLLRPNAHTLALLSKYATPGLKSLNGKCIGMYIRHGDKGIEMKLVDPVSFGKVSTTLWNTLYPVSGVTSNHTSSPKALFFGTETLSVFVQMLQWGRQNGWITHYNPLLLHLFRAKNVHFSKEHIKLMKEDILYKKQIFPDSDFSLFDQYFQQIDGYSRNLINGPQHHSHSELEYWSIIVNLIETLQCSGFVCTLQSNFCRVIDELRSTVAWKYDSLFADLSIETCSNPPCIGGKGIKGYDWRI